MDSDLIIELLPVAVVAAITVVVFLVLRGQKPRLEDVSVSRMGADQTFLRPVSPSSMAGPGDAPATPPARPVGPGLGVGIFLFPYIFAWFLLAPGYSKRARLIGFGWMAVTLLMVFGRLG